MKHLLIIYPHWPPSNLAGIHRPRLIANFAKDFGWHVTVLTIEPKYYEEEYDWNMVKLVSPDVEIRYVKAIPVYNRLRLIGDIALRGFTYLYREAKKIIEEKDIGFLWIPIPSFYTALLGRMLHTSTGIPYGIDYIDPWVNGFTNQEKIFSRSWASNILGKILEPLAVSKAVLISGVSTPYYQAVLDRNFKGKDVVHVGMPYGFDPNDHAIEVDVPDAPWNQSSEIKPVVYAGAFLPKSHYFIDALFKSIAIIKSEGKWDKSVHLYFLGTGPYPGKSITDYALEHNIKESVHEIRSRFPYLSILNLLSRAYGIMVIGSTEKHYTASKTYQALLSKRPVFAVFHSESSAVKVLEECEAAQYLVTFQEGMNKDGLIPAMTECFSSFINNTKKNNTKNWNPDLYCLDKYSAKASAHKLFDAIELCLKRKD